MVLFNYSTKELTAKIVYYGPGLCGKTTNLEFIHRSLPEKTRGKMLSLATQTDRTLFFDFLPLDLGSLKGMKTRVQLYTVPGQVFYDATRKLVLKGADGVVFVADSQKEMMESNLESWNNLKENLSENGFDVRTMPMIIQYNKRDLPNVLSLRELNQKINEFKVPHVEAVALTGEGVQESLKGITKLVLESLNKRHKKDLIPQILSRQVEDTEELQEDRMEESDELIEELPSADVYSEEQELSSGPEEYEELEELTEVAAAPEPSPLEKTQSVSIPEITADDAAFASRVQQEEEEGSEWRTVPESRGLVEPRGVPVTVQISSNPGTQEIEIPIDLWVGPAGEEVRVRLAVELKIKILPSGPDE
jgi:signal recognition particle receptor subunit beta